MADKTPLQFLRETNPKELHAQMMQESVEANTITLHLILIAKKSQNEKIKRRLFEISDYVRKQADTNEAIAEMMLFAHTEFKRLETVSKEVMAHQIELEKQIRILKTD